MNIHLWRILGGLVRLVMIYLPIQLAWLTVSYLDAVWYKFLWQFIFPSGIFFSGVILTAIAAYFTGLVSEKRWGTWIDQHIFTKIPVLGHFFVKFNPQVRDLLQRAQGGLIARYQSEWRVAFLTVVHRTKEGCLGSVGYIGLPPIPQQLDQNSPVKVREVMEGGTRRYELIPRDIAVKQEITFGTTVPPDAYKDVVQITFGELVLSLRLLGEKGGTT